MGNIRCVRFPSLEAAIEAIAPYDDGFMNFCVGSLHEHLHKSSEDDKFKKGHFFGLYHGEDLELTLTVHAAHDTTWKLLCPQHRQSSLTPAFLDTAANLLVDAVLQSVDPRSAFQVFGYKAAVDAFTAAWTARAAATGVELSVKPLYSTVSSYATRETIPPPPSAPSTSALALATMADFEELIPLYLDFSTYAPGTRTREEDEARLRGLIPSGLTWVYRVDGAIVGFISLGRPSPKTIAVRHVYVHPAHRRKGIAEAMVGAVTRYFLGVQSAGGEDVFAEPPAVGVKDFVCINAVDIAASRVYRRAGFLFPEQTADGVERGGIDPKSGQKGWFYSVLRGITKPVPEETA
ncbi:acyl-CoA N-acyltransferase [Cubamyces lactineus]|nr:acyl-CoA N-acyltransferase [Cubamyces lactineus]